MNVILKVGDQRSLAKRSVQTIYHSSDTKLRHMGLDPYEERLLIALLGGGAALIFALVFLFICFRKYRIDRSGGQDKKWNPQLYMQPGAAYYQMGQPQMQMSMDPAVLDPSRAFSPSGAVGSNPSYPPQPHVDNTAYASLPPSHFQQQQY